MSAIRTRRLVVSSDELELAGEVCLPPDPKGVVVLLHGLPSAAPADPGDEGYAGFARVFAARGWIAAWADMRAARGAPGFFSIRAWVRDALAIVDAVRALDELGDLPLVLVGSSAGGVVSLEAVRRGARVDAVVLLAAPAEWMSFTADAREGVRRITEDAGMRVAPEVMQDPLEWAAEFVEVAAEQAVAATHLPLLIVHGSADDVVPVAHAARIAGRAERANLWIIEGAGHQLRRHDGIVELVLEWLEGVLA
jgi:dipeptidyl aminopeptidase/acylaminoacyl peptidase